MLLLFHFFSLFFFFLNLSNAMIKHTFSIVGNFFVIVRGLFKKKLLYVYYVFANLLPTLSCIDSSLPLLFYLLIRSSFSIIEPQLYTYIFMRNPQSNGAKHMSSLCFFLFFSYPSALLVYLLCYLFFRSIDSREI